MDSFNTVIEQMKKFSKDASRIQGILRKTKEGEDNFATDVFLNLLDLLPNLRMLNKLG